MDRNPHEHRNNRIKYGCLSDFSFNFIPQHLMINIGKIFLVKNNPIQGGLYENRTINRYSSSRRRT